MANSAFENLERSPIPFNQTQGISYQNEILLCGDQDKRDCYSYHTIKNEYRLICYYPNNINLFGHCVLKWEESKDIITLLSFGSSNNKNFILVMSYSSVWDNVDENYNENENGDKNKWLYLKNKDGNNVTFIDNDYNLIGARGLIGGKNKNLLFITYLKSENDMILFCETIGLLIKYDEKKNEFEFYDLPICDNINKYAYLHFNNSIFLFGGYHVDINANITISKLIY
ncbi:hypothetical protein RFI_26671 [Reticulomyxa filosa]|uniref:Uncharacterized protein n=1 Tax=Reticulomyxa filosa TaxID=46433 RepID=X6MB54_RETFI|nr:hypothetical protein RFI_26671 [Reticulomyxa filosa]|eukprot:ETO10707.1 hypothetical protein RFI_26671 [Reticulomyxa filosa]